MNAESITVSEPGGRDARRVRVVGTQCSWLINNIGNLSCFVRIETLRAVGLGGDLVGKWLQWDHTLLGRWGGVITERPIAEGVCEIQAEGWAGLLRGQVIGDWDLVPQGSPAGVLQRALSVAVSATEKPSFVRVGRIDEGNDPIRVMLGGQDILEDLLPELADLGLEWIVDADRVLSAGPRLGRDRSHVIRLVEGRDMLDPQIATGALPASPSQTLQIEGAQLAAHKGRGGTLALRSTPHWEAPQITVLPRLSGRTLETRPLQATLANRAGSWVKFGLGDTVSILLESDGFSGTLRVMKRGYNGETNTLEIAGEATPDAVQA